MSKDQCGNGHGVFQSFFFDSKYFFCRAQRTNLFHWMRVVYTREAKGMMRRTFGADTLTQSVCGNNFARPTGLYLCMHLFFFQV